MFLAVMLFHQEINSPYWTLFEVFLVYIHTTSHIQRHLSLFCSIVLHNCIILATVPVPTPADPPILHVHQFYFQPVVIFPHLDFYPLHREIDFLLPDNTRCFKSSLSELRTFAPILYVVGLTPAISASFLLVLFSLFIFSFSLWVNFVPKLLFKSFLVP